MADKIVYWLRLFCLFDNLDILGNLVISFVIFGVGVALGLFILTIV